MNRLARHACLLALGASLAACCGIRSVNNGPPATPAAAPARVLLQLEIVAGHTLRTGRLEQAHADVHTAPDPGRRPT